MPSRSLTELNRRLEEVTALLGADPTPKGALPDNPDLTAAINRAATVMLCAHFQGYIEDLVDEVVDTLNGAKASFEPMPPELVEVHLRELISKIEGSDGIVRVSFVRDLMAEAPRWRGGQRLQAGQLDPQKIRHDFGNPWPGQVKRVLRRVGIDDIFRQIARSRRRELTRTLNEIVEKRNGIAHGDRAQNPTREDLERYASAVSVVCERIDRAVGRRCQSLCAAPHPLW